MQRVLRRACSKRGLRLSSRQYSDHAFRQRSLWELLRAYGVLKCCSYDVVVDNSEWLLSTGDKLLGRRFFGALVEPTFYRQFVGGSTLAEMEICVDALGKTNVRPMIACSVEEDVPHGAGTPGERALAMYERNGETILSCLAMCTKLRCDATLMQLKISGILPTNVLVRLGHAFDDAAEVERVVHATANCVLASSLKDEKLLGIDTCDRKVLQLALSNLGLICKKAVVSGVKILVDAEYMHMKSGIDLLALALMSVFNGDRPMVWNTYQCYLPTAKQTMESHFDLTARVGVHFGVKLVRGAYMDAERRTATENNSPDPVCNTYEMTNCSYDRSLCSILELIKKSPRRCDLVVATHNEDSIRTALTKMQELELAESDPRINFAQLLGMYDQVTYPLASQGYNVYKSIPYGPLGELLPYLARRARENRAVLRGPVTERRILAREIRSRLSPFYRSAEHQKPTRPGT